MSRRKAHEKETLENPVYGPDDIDRLVFIGQNYQAILSRKNQVIQRQRAAIRSMEATIRGLRDEIHLLKTGHRLTREEDLGKIKAKPIPVDGI